MRALIFGLASLDTDYGTLDGRDGSRISGVKRFIRRS
jgi:hypothetical protein